MKHYLLLGGILLLMTATPRQAKAQFFMDLKGEVIREHEPDIDGTPYYIEFWSHGYVVTEKGVTYKDVTLKFDVKDDRPVFRSNDDKTMAFVEPIKKFSINDIVFANGYPAVSGYSSKSYYQVLADGNAQFLKHRTKTIKDTKSYGAPVAGRQYVDQDAYYIFKDGNIRTIKLNKKDVLAELNDKQAQVQNYLASHQTNFKNENELAALFDYYNSLKKDNKDDKAKS